MGKKIHVRLVMHEDYAKEVRCDECHALLFKALLSKSQETGERKIGIEVKCRRCGTLNRY